MLKHVLLWLKEFGIRERKSYADHLLLNNGEDYSVGFGLSYYQLGMSNYCMTALFNRSLQTYIIEHISTIEEHKALQEKGLEQMMAGNTSLKLVEKTFTVKALPRNKAASVTPITDKAVNHVADMNLYPGFEHAIPQHINSTEAYEAALTRVKEIFNSAYKAAFIQVEGKYIKNVVNEDAVLLPLILGLKALKKSILYCPS